MTAIDPAQAETYKRNMIAELRQTGLEHLNSWARELEDGAAPSSKFRAWIENLINYYGEKDRTYAAWLESLIHGRKK